MKIKQNIKQITQKRYLEILQERKKSLCIASFQNKDNIDNCFKEFENLIYDININDLDSCYKDNNFLTLISGNKKRLVFSQDNEKDKIFGNLEGLYYLFNYNGYDFVINVVSDEDLTKKNFKLYSLDVSFLEC